MSTQNTTSDNVAEHTSPPDCPQAKFDRLVLSYAKEAGFTDAEIHDYRDNLARLIQITAWGADVVIQKHYHERFPQSVCMLDMSQDLEEKFMHGGSPSDEFNEYLAKSK